MLHVSGPGCWKEVRKVMTSPKDAFRKRVYIAPLGLWLTLDAGTFEKFQYNIWSKRLKIGLSPASLSTPIARLLIEQPCKIKGIGKFSPREILVFEREGYTVPLSSAIRWVELVQK